MAAVLSFVDHSFDPPTTLAGLAKGQSARVIAVKSNPKDVSPELSRRLAELGFLPGERIKIVARGVFGGDPIAVRVGTATFALRRFEADCIQVAVETA